VDRLRDLGATLPSNWQEIPTLAPWAVEFRYGETIDDSLDREQALALVSETIAWARDRISTD